MTVAAPLVGLLVGGLIQVAAPAVGAAYQVPPASQMGWILAGVLVALPAVLAAWNDGLVVCWLLDFGPLFGIALGRFGFGTPTDLYAPLYAAFGFAGVAAVGWGSLGFAVGEGLRWCVRSMYVAYLDSTAP